MALKRKVKRNALFSMASMTDIIFLLLIFFMVLSTLIVPNAIKVNLPSSQSTAPDAQPYARITIDSEGSYYLALDKQAPVAVSIEELEQLLMTATQEQSEFYVALFADEMVPYKEIVRVLNIVTPLNLKLVLATQALKATDNSQVLHYETN